MSWNWQLDNWLHFKYNPESIILKERQFLLSLGNASAYLQNIQLEERNQFIVEILSIEGMESSKIEGEILERESLRSSINKHFGLQKEVKRGANKELGMADVLCNVYETFEKPLTHEMLWEWHSMLFNGQISCNCHKRFSYESSSL